LDAPAALARPGDSIFGETSAEFASTDGVAMDVIGWAAVEQLRKDHGLPTLTAVGRDPAYLRAAGDIGLGVADKNRIRLREVKL